MRAAPYHPVITEPQPGSPRNQSVAPLAASLNAVMLAEVEIELLDELGKVGHEESDNCREERTAK